VRNWRIWSYALGCASGDLGGLGAIAKTQWKAAGLRGRRPALQVWWSAKAVEVDWDEVKRLEIRQLWASINKLDKETLNMYTRLRAYG
jgi:hypothetical protein